MKKNKIVPQDNKIKRDCSYFFSSYIQKDSYDELVLSIDRMILKNTAKNRITFIVLRYNFIFFHEDETFFLFKFQFFLRLC